MTEHDDTDAPDGADTEIDVDVAAAEPALVHGCVVSDSCGQTVVHPTREQYLDLLKALADDGYTMVVDLCGVDYLDYADRPLPAGIDGERFEIVVNLVDLAHRRRLRLRVQVPDDDPTLPSLFDLHPGVEAFERETYDMFGVEFTDHPDMTRILMPEDWIGHPLRKDYDTGHIPVQFKGAHS
jgi:NADH-quinone oxidoreductase subunit C